MQSEQTAGIVGSFVLLLTMFTAANLLSCDILFGNRSQWLEDIIYKSINPHQKFHFSMMPEMYIVKNFTIYSFHEKFPTGLAEFYDKNDVKNNNLSTFAFTNSWDMDQQFYHLRNIYFAQTNNFITPDGTVYYLETRCNFKVCERNLTDIYEHCIAVVGPWSSTYGDYLTGTLVRISIVPKEYFKFSVTLSPYEGFEHLLIELLEVLGVKEYTLKPAPHWESGQMIFCHNLYTLFYNNWNNNPGHGYFPHLSNFGKLFRDYGNLFIKYHHLENIKPTDYTIYNRSPDARYRIITNFNNITEAIRKQHPDIDFKIIIGSFRTTEETAKCWRTVLWNFATIGSNHLNSIFMSSKTVMCIYYLDRYDFNIPATLASSGIYFVIFQDPSLRMYVKTVTLNVSRILPYVNRSLEILRDGHI